MSSPASPRRADPMEDFLAREKAALEALESVELASPPADGGAAMDIDEPMGEFHSSGSPGHGPTQSSISPLAAQPPIGTNSGSRSASTSPVANGAPVLTSTVQALNHASNGPRSPTSPVTLAARGGRAETEAMAAWKRQRAADISEREAAAQQLREERKAKAAGELKALQREWQERVESTGTSAGREKSKVTAWDEEKPAGGDLRKEQVPWERVHELIESLPKPAKDCSRLLSIVRSLALDKQ